MDDLAQIYQPFSEHDRFAEKKILSSFELDDVYHDSICDECMNGKDTERHLQGKCLPVGNKQKYPQ